MTWIPGEALACKIWETGVIGGIRGLLSPWQIRREGRARAEVRAYELRQIAQAEQDSLEIKNGITMINEKGSLIENKTHQYDVRLSQVGNSVGGAERLPPDVIVSAIADQMSKTENIKRLINIAKILSLAEQEAEEIKDSEVNDQPVDPDWFIRWRNAARDVSGHEAQQLWARVLVEEAKAPGAISLRTVEFLQHI